MLVVLAAAASPGTTERVSVDSLGNQANGRSISATISADGRFVVFYSDASNLVMGDTNGRRDVFVRDRQTGGITRVSVSSASLEGNDDSGDYGSANATSADGRYVAFYSSASNLVAGDTNQARDIFVHDRDTGETMRVSVSSAGNQANDDSFYPDLSGTGRYVAFQSRASDLVAADTNSKSDVFVHDRQTGEISRVSVDSVGNQANGDSFAATISADGRLVAFYSSASNLVSPDTNGSTDVFVHDRQTGATSRASVSSAGEQANSHCSVPDISADGRYVAFYSSASNLVATDTNSKSDVFVHDRDTGETTRVSVDSFGNQGNRGSGLAALSSEGRYVAFDSAASNLVVGDTNTCGTFTVPGTCPDVFVHDRLTGETTLVSVDSAGGQASGISGNPDISGDGRFVAFGSDAANLVFGDTNGLGDVFVHDRGTAIPPIPTPTPTPTATPTPTPSAIGGIVELAAASDAPAEPSGSSATDHALPIAAAVAAGAVVALAVGGWYARRRFRQRRISA